MQTSANGDLTVRFLGGPPSEEVVRFAQSCASQTPLAVPVTLVLQWNANKTAPREVRIESEGRVVLREAEPDLLVAVRNAFARAAIATKPTRATS